jgi:hypothetical protein
MSSRFPERAKALATRRVGLACLLAAGIACGGNARAGGAPATSQPPLGDLVVRASSETALYTDSDQVTVVTPSISASIEDPLAGWSAGASYLVDVVSAASVDVVATATPRWSEVRHVVGAHGRWQPSTVAVEARGSVSSEPDYLSLGGGGVLEAELYDKNLVIFLGYAYGHDTIGRAGSPFEVFARILHKHAVTAGASVVMSRSSLLTGVADVVIESGDPSKPYRYLPTFEPDVVNDVPAGASIELVDALRADERPLERLPGRRQRYALTGRLAHRFAGSTLRIEERLYGDSWGLMATTTDTRWLVDIGRRLTIWPRARVHLQGAADFWARADPLRPAASGRLAPPEIRAGDRELGPLATFTGGGGVACDLGRVPGSRAWVLSLSGDAILTRFRDAIYLQQRSALFAALSIEARLD